MTEQPISFVVARSEGWRDGVLVVKVTRRFTEAFWAKINAPRKPYAPFCIWPQVWVKP